MAYPGDTSRFGDAELADLGRQGPNDFFNGLLAPYGALKLLPNLSGMSART